MVKQCFYKSFGKHGLLYILNRSTLSQSELIQVFFISHHMCDQALLLLFKSKTNSLLTGLFAIVLKRILLWILTMTNNYS